jgi:hypothetical protein
MADVNVKGHTGLLSVYDTTAYKPIVCLTSTSMSSVLRLIEKVNYCTQGETIRTIDGIDRTVSFDAEVMTVDSSAEAPNASYAELLALQGEEQTFKLEGRGVAQYFKAVISDLSDTFPGEGDATFSGTLTINGDISETDPEEEEEEEEE